MPAGAALALVAPLLAGAPPVRGAGPAERIAPRDGALPPDGAEADDESGSMGPLLAADGSCVVFDSSASNLVPEDAIRREDLFVVDLRRRAWR